MRASDSRLSLNKLQWSRVPPYSSLKVSQLQPFYSSKASPTPINFASTYETGLAAASASVSRYTQLTSQKVVQGGLCGTYRLWRLHYSCRDKNKLRLLPPLRICCLRGYLESSTMKGRVFIFDSSLFSSYFLHDIRDANPAIKRASQTFRPSQRSP